ncbi:MAG: hypothetical protein R3C11_03215 [Planctomycetaceae bacterium]
MACTLNQFLKSLESAIATGQIGQPVAARLRIVTAPELIPPFVNEFLDWASFGLTSGDPHLFKGNYRISRHVSGLQTNVQFRTDGGANLSLTWVENSTQPASLKFLLIGNHGLIRLEEPLQSSWNFAENNGPAKDWFSQLLDTLNSDSSMGSFP